MLGIGTSLPGFCCASPPVLAPHSKCLSCYLPLEDLICHTLSRFLSHLGLLSCMHTLAPHSASAVSFEDSSWPNCNLRLPGNLSIKGCRRGQPNSIRGSAASWPSGQVDLRPSCLGMSSFLYKKKSRWCNDQRGRKSCDLGVLPPPSAQSKGQNNSYAISTTLLLYFYTPEYFPLLCYAPEYFPCVLLRTRVFSPELCSTPEYFPLHSVTH